MALNKWGMGFVIGATDMASKVISGVGRTYDAMTKQVEKSANRQQMAMRDLAMGGAMSLASKTGFSAISRLMEEAGRYGTKIAEVSTMVDSSLFPTEKIEKLTMDMARFGQDAQIQAAGLYDAISAGYGTVASATDMMTSANRLAVAGVTDVKTAVNGLTGALNNYASMGETSTSISDAMFTAVKAGKTTIAELSDSMGRVAPIASQVGLSFNELMAATATATTKNIATNEAMSGLKAMFANILKPTADAEKAAKKIGMQFNLTALQTKGFGSFLGELVKKSKGDKQVLTDLFGSIEAANVIFALTSENGAKFNDTLDQMNKKAGATEAAFKKVEATYAHQSKVFDAVSGNIWKLLGASFERLAAPMLNVFNKVADSIERFLQSLPPGVVDVLTGIATAILALVGAVGAFLVLKGTMGMMGMGIVGVAKSLLQFVIIAPVAILLFGGLALAAYAAYKAFQKNTGGISISWEDMVKRITLAWEGMVSIVKGESFSKALEEALGKGENKGVANFLRGFELFVERMKAFWAGLKRGFDEGVTALAESSSMKRLMSSMESIFAVFTGGEAANSQEVLENFGNKGIETGNKLAKLGEIALEAITKLVQMGGKLVEFVGTMSGGEISAGINSVIDGLHGVWGSLQAIITVVGGVAKAILFVANLLQVVAAFVAESIAAVVHYVTTSASVLNNLRKGNFAAAAQNIKEFAATPIYTETIKQVGDVERSGWAPESTRGLEPSQRQTQALLDRAIKGRDTAMQEFNKQKAEGQDTSSVEALLVQLNESIWEISKRPPPPMRVTMDAGQVNAVVRKEQERQVERELAFETEPF
jgi:TP901 family phage tail tape measure protein